MKRIAQSMLGLGLVAALLSIPVLAQQSGGTEPKDPKAKEKAQLISEGQATLSQATSIAEKHLKGVALQANSRLQDTQSSGKIDDELLSRGDRNSRVMYDLEVFSKDQIHRVTVDGLERRVVTGQPDGK